MHHALPAALVAALSLAAPSTAQTSGAGSPQAAGAAAPKMVQPESLAQGFVVVVKDKAGVANPDSPIYMASSHNGWSAGDAKMKLTPRSDMRWQIEWDKPKLDSRVAFKFTRGSWETVEVDKDFKDVDNRLLPMVDASKLAPGEKPVIELEIVAWRDQRPGETAQSPLNPYRDIKVGAGSVKRLEIVGGGVSIVRDAIVWLPPGYDAPENKDRRYPVLYLQDGQNVFEKIPQIPAEWQADETAGKLIDAKQIEPLIIVAIPHAGDKRAEEYLPVAALEGVTPRADKYVDFLVNEVMPRVNRAFRTKTGPENTAIGGASLGGVVSLYAATSRPDVFGKVLAESTPLLAQDRAAMRYFEGVSTWPKRVYFGMGGKELGKDGDPKKNEAYAKSAGEFESLMGRKGVADKKVVVAADDVHNEEAWGRRLPEALKFLFPPAK